MLDIAVILSAKKNIFQLMFVIKLNLINYMTGEKNLLPDVYILVSNLHIQIADVNLQVPDVQLEGHIQSMLKGTNR